MKEARPFQDSNLDRRTQYVWVKKGDKQKAEFYLSPIKDPGVSMEDYFKKVINQKVFKISEY